MICERCHKDRDPAVFAQIASIGVFCDWCRENIQEVIDKYGEDAAKGWTYDPRKDLIEFIEGEGKRVLDCGCWAGYTLQALQDRGHLAYGLDIEDNRAVAKDAPMWQMDLEMPLTELMCGAVRPDYILFGDVLEHLENPFPALKAARRWLAPDGRIVISVPNMGWIGAVIQIANQHFPRDESGHFDKTHLRFYTLEEIVRTVQEAGFRVRQYKYRWFPGTTPWPEGAEGEQVFQWENIAIRCTRELYEQLNAYQILLEAEPV